MSREEADVYQVSEEERRRLIRLNDGKLNLSLKADPTWYRLASINIGNRTEEYPNGDNIQAVETWEPPDMWSEMPPSLCCRIIDEIDAGMPDGERYSKHNRAAERAAWKVVMKHKPDLTEVQAKKAIATWVKNGILYEEPYDSKKERKSALGLYANPAKRPGGTGD
jgi:hypothetical protein